MGKNIYDILNETKVDLNEYDRKDFNDIEKKKIKKNFKKSIKSKNNRYKRYVSAILVAILAFFDWDS